MPRGKPLSSDAIAELTLRRFCGEPPISIARVMGIGYKTASRDYAMRQQYVQSWYARNRDRQRAKCRERYLAKFKYDSRRRRLAKLARYGLTEEAFLALQTAQGGKCAICGRPDSGTALHSRMSIDHDHRTDLIRGLLCQPCNQGLGAFYDRPQSLAAAIQYLAKWGII